MVEKGESVWMKSLSISGYRSFARSESIDFAVPNGDPGSGLTILVGPNGGGKSTILEALHGFSATENISFSEGKRNKRAGDRICLTLQNTAGDAKEIRTVAQGGSESNESGPKTEPIAKRFFVLPSRRRFDAHFSRGVTERHQYMQRIQLPNIRGSTLPFSQRLFRIQREDETRKKFDEAMSKVIQPVPRWCIEQSDQGTTILSISSAMPLTTAKEWEMVWSASSS